MAAIHRYTAARASNSRIKPIIMQATITTDRNWSLTGTIGFHVVLLVLLSLVKCNSFSGNEGDGGGGGGGNNGFMSMDAAGVGTVVDGVYEPDPEPIPTPDDPSYAEESTDVIPDDSQADHVVNPQHHQRPVDPSETPEQRKQRLEQQRLEQERINRQNRLSGGLDGGGSSGTGGGSGGGNGGGNGPGDGDGNGNGTGGGTGGGDGSGRKAVNQPDCGRDAEEKGWVEVRVTINADGSVANAKAIDSSAFSNVSKFRQRAEDCARNYRFNTGPSGQTKRIVIQFSPK